MWDLPSPSTITYFWNFGSTLGICLMVQIVTGLFLTFHYTSYAPERFASVAQIMREVWAGWLIRLAHINGASIFFLFIYLHLWRGIFYIRASNGKVWTRGVTILIMLIAISFLGYVLPWGQISYWAVAVITNLFSVMPLIGHDLVNWIWGGFSVGAPTLSRFYSLHFLIPFILAIMVVLHLALLHKNGSRNRLGIQRNIDKIHFHPYFTVKDLLFIVAAIMGALTISYFLPYVLGDPVNNIPANPIQTPVHIQPEWYFLTSYAILRALPSKSAGVVALFISVAIFYVIPVFKMKFSTKFSIIRMYVFWSIVACFCFLTIIGAMPAEEPYIEIAQKGSFVYLVTLLSLNV